MKIKIRWKQLTFTVLITYTFSILTFPLTSSALMPYTLPSNAKSNVQCDAFCKPFGTGSGTGVSGNSGWSSQDDDLCNQLGAPTSTGQRIAPTPAPSYAALGCNINLTQGVIDTLNAQAATNTDIDPTQPCDEAGKLKDRCTFHNSQVESQCFAYNAISGNKGVLAADAVLLATDAVVAALCLGACLSLNEVAGKACSVIAGLAGTAEAATTLAMQFSPLQQFINASSTLNSDAGAGVGAALGGAAALTGIGSRLVKQDDYVIHPDAAAKTEEIAEANKNTQSAAEKAKNQARALTCATAGLFSAMVGVRTYALGKQRTVAKDACNAINGLLSQAPSTSTSSTVTPAPTPDLNTATASGNGSGSGSGSGTGMAFTPDQLATVMSCASSNNNDLALTYSCVAAKTGSTGNAATDGGLISNLPPGIPNPIADIPAFVNKALQDGAGAALSGLSGGTGGDTGAALTQLASAAQDQGAQLASTLGLSSTYSGGGGGSGGGGKSDTGFGSLFGAMGSGGAAGTSSSPGLASFGAASKSNDIWHSGTPLNLFEIVSGKITQVTPRVR